MDSVSLAPKVNRQWSLESHSANHKELQASRMALCPNGALAVLASGKKGKLFLKFHTEYKICYNMMRLYFTFFLLN